MDSTTIDEVRADPQGSVRENLLLSDVALAVEELKWAAGSGCQLVADLTVEGLGPRRLATANAAAEAGLHVALGIGRYTSVAMTAEQREESTDSLARRWLRQAEEGVDGCTVGVVGELGVGREFTTAERRTVEAGAVVAAESGLPVVIHAEMDTPHLHAALDIVENRGVDLTRVTVAHLDWRLDSGQIGEVVGRGCWASFDLFGRPRTTRPDARWSYPADDNQRVEAVIDLVRRGHGEHLVLSQDVCMRHLLRRYGGAGYGYLSHAVFPRLRTALGGDLLHQLSRVNPLRSLAAAV